MRSPSQYLCLTLILMSALAWSKSAAAAGKRYAVLIGVGDYPESSNLNRLAADKDTDKLSADLAALGWQVTLLNAKQSNPARKPTQENILRVLGIEWKPDTKEARSKRTAERFTGDRDLELADIVLFFFGGHGVTDKNEQDTLLPLDAHFDQGRIDNPEKLIQVRWVRDALQATRAGKIVILIDACREGAGNRATTRLGIRTATPDQPPLATIAPPDEQRLLIFKSTGLGKWAHEIQREGMGVFSYFIHRLLTEESLQQDANRLKDQQLTFQDLVSWTTAQTSRFVADLPPTSKKGPQEPWVEGNQQLDFVIKVLPPPPAPPDLAAPDPPPENPPRIISFTPDSRRINRGESTQLQWKVADAASCEIDHDVSSAVDLPEGAVDISPVVTTTYWLKCKSARGQLVRKSTNVEVRQGAALTIFCCDIFGNRRCQTNPGPVGSACFCYGLGWGRACP